MQKMVLDFPENIELLVVAPFPSAERVKEGWMSRINMIDKILSSRPRLYLNFSPYHVHGRDDVLVQHSPNAWEIYLSPDEPLHKQYVSSVVDVVNGVYVHTCHLAEFIEDWLPTGKFVVDMHGIVPEEETMLGRPELAPKYEKLEQVVLQHCKKVVVVTDAMRIHFEEKYPTIKANFHVLPIIETYNTPPRSASAEELPVKALYAGGRQVWQNLDATLKLAQDTVAFAQFTFLSHEHDLIKLRADELDLKVEPNYGFRTKQDLPAEYAQNDFGLVLRDESAVNKVSCPTKLSEYLDFGLIPVVRYASLGDFKALGYAYVTEEDFRNGFIPDQASRAWMREVNKNVITTLRKKFIDSVDEIRSWFS